MAAAAPTCPRLQSTNTPDNIVTIDNINDLRVSTQSVAINTVVTLMCQDGRTLSGASKVTCIGDGTSAKWSPDPPTCQLTTVDSTGLTQQELIVVGVVSAICGLVIIMIIVMVCACWYKRRKDRLIYKRPSSEYSYTGGDQDRNYKQYSPYTSFPHASRDDTLNRSYRNYNSAPGSAIPSSFPRTHHPTAYELAVRSVDARPKPYVNYAGPRIARASSDTYEDYVAEKNYKPYYIGGGSRSYDNEGFHGQWTDRYDKKKLAEFNRDALTQGRDPFLWRTRLPAYE